MKTRASEFVLLLAAATIPAISATVPTKVAGVTASGCPEVAPGRAPVFVGQELERLLTIFGTEDESAESWISKYLLDFLTENPCVFFEVMKQHPDSFDLWLKELDRNSFEDRGGCMDLECFRKSYIDATEHTVPYDLRAKPELLKMFERLLSRLKEIKVTHHRI